MRVARLRVEVVYALPWRQDVVVLQLAEGATAGEAVRGSGLPAAGAGGLGIGGRRVGLEERLSDGDRVEILRPLATDPGEARRRRARKARRLR